MPFARSLRPHRKTPAVDMCGLLLFASALLLLATTSVVNAGTLERVADSGTLKLGYRLDARPFSYQDAGRAVGYSLVLCQKVADAVQAKLGRSIKVEYVQVGSRERFDRVQDGSIDLLCGAATETLGRREQVSFSIPIFTGGIGALLRTDAPPRMRALLAGEEPEFRPRWRASFGQILEQRTFSVRAGTTAETWVNERIDKFDIIAKVVPVADYAEGLNNVIARRADVLFGDRAILLDQAKRSPSADDLVVLARYFTYELLALALERGDEDFRLLVDRTLSGLYRSGEIKEIYTTFFGKPDEMTLTLFSRAALPE